MKHYKWFSLLIICLLSFGACSDDDKDFGEQGVLIDPPTVLGITSSTAQLQATLSSASDVILSKRGFCYSTSPDPTIYNSTTVAEGGETFSATIEGLMGNTTYYVRAFVSIYEDGVAYSTQIEITTGEGTLEEQLAQYKAPTYADNYSSIAAWSMRNKWNLANVHDPTVVLADDGYYYMYQTDASYGNAHTAGGHFHGRRSKDLVYWEYLGGTMPELPEWVIPKLNEIRNEMGLGETTANKNDFGYWAPCVRKVSNGLYRMYYSIVCPGLIDGDGTWSERAFIGMMENSDPANNDGWVDKGYVVTNASDKGLNFHVPANDWANCYYKWNAIDPSYIITEGQHWLIYGSWHSGLVAMELNAETGMPKQSLGLSWATGTAPAEYGQLIYTRQANNRWQASEGPEIVYNSETGYYYLFVAYDALGVPYNTRVARSKNIAGPYYGIDGTNVSNGGDMLPVVTHPYKFANGDGWVGFAHCAVFDDGKGNWYYSSQARLPESVDNYIMMGHVRSIRWTEDGWPLVMPERYGAVPRVPISEEELIGDWEHIDLSYSYGRQKEASAMTFSSEHTISEGPWQGSTWSYDASKQILTVNDDIKLYLQREVDWEANPRTHTIVYAAYGSNFKTYWGKKKK